jgi:hypothetical protein
MHRRPGDDRRSPVTPPVSFEKLRNGGLIGFCTVEITPPGLTIVDCPLRVNGEGSYWCALPAKPVLDQSGRQVEVGGRKQYAAILKWRDRERGDRFSSRVIELVREQYPGVLP